MGDADAPKTWDQLRDCTNLQEVVLLSTCLRTEVYAVVDRFHDAVDEIEGLLATRVGVDVDQLSDHLDVRFDHDVAAHLFAVASGLESAVLGESEILGQVRRAFEQAQAERMCGPVLGDLFRHAVFTGKRVRSETAIGRGTTSFAHAAVELAEARRPGGLRGAKAVVAGAGVMGAGVASALAHLAEDRRPASVTVVSRRESRALEAARGAGHPTVGSAPFEELAALVASADVLVTALDVSAPVLGADELGAGMRRGPLLAVDMGVPRNLAADVRQLSEVEVVDMADLRTSVERALGERRQELSEARAIVDHEIERHRQAARARGAAPVIAALRSRMEELRRGELERRRGQFSALSDQDWDQVDAVTRAVLAKLVHEPTVALKEASGTPRGERLVEALRLLYDL